MAVIVGLVVGFVVGLRRPDTRFVLVVGAPLAVAALEIVVNLQLFGLTTVAVWSVLLVVLTVSTTWGGLWLGHRLAMRRATPPPPT